MERASDAGGDTAVPRGDGLSDGDCQGKGKTPFGDRDTGRWPLVLAALRSGFERSFDFAQDDGCDGATRV